MKAIEILYNLSPYQMLLEKLHEQLNKEEKDYEWTRHLSSQYSFIELELKRKSKKDIQVYENTAIKITFEIVRDQVVLKQLYCEDASRASALEESIKTNKAVHEAHWHTEPNNTWYHNETVTAYINMADEIAGRAYYCNKGDDYRPGNFSEIAVSIECILLKQINHYHAKSIDHKDDYLLRNLEFYIPLAETAPKKAYFDYTIGALSISFSDRSSANNKSCGQQIVEQILQQKNSFDQEKK